MKALQPHAQHQDEQQQDEGESGAQAGADLDVAEFHGVSRLLLLIQQARRLGRLVGEAVTTTKAISV
jgi:hypothetical protein